MYFFCLSLLALVTLGSSQQCPIVFDSRVAAGTSLASFDAATSVFGNSNVFGKGLAFSKLVVLPTVNPSLFDVNTIPVEVTISDQSIFNGQAGFRRAELQPAGNTGTEGFATGLKTLHFSVQKDAARPLNTSHEYQLAFLESNDFSTNQFVLKTGSIIGDAVAAASPDTLFLVGNVISNPVVTLFSTPFTPGVFHNFGLTLDFTANTVQVLYSQGTAALAAVGAVQKNDLSGQGQLHFGALKKPVGNNLKDITKEGTQEAGINEGVIFGGIFEEDSTGGCASLSPVAAKAGARAAA